jgi:hypothetical protein
MALTAGTGGAVLASSAASGAHRPIGQSKPNQGPSNLTDHGGDILASSHVVEIFWGPTSAFDPELRPAMESLLGGMGGSAYLQVAQQYMHGAAISSSRGTSLVDQSQPPKQALSPNGLAAEVAKLVPTPDPATIYFVFTSNMPHISYCAYHSQGTANGVTVVVAYVPLQPAGCSIYGRGTDLGLRQYDESVQTSADSAAHEFMESVTDPHLNAWYDKNGAELADKCEYDYQGIVHLANGSTWQIQSNWSNALNGGACDPGLGH